MWYGFVNIQRIQQGMEENSFASKCFYVPGPCSLYSFLRGKLDDNKKRGKS